jgi:lysophospholipase L1-like esterase
MGKYFLDDGLHPNEAGHRLMAAKTIEIIKDRLNLERNG